MGIYKRRFEDMKSYVKRVESATYRAIEEHRIKVGVRLLTYPNNNYSWSKEQLGEHKVNLNKTLKYWKIRRKYKRNKRREKFRIKLPGQKRNGKLKPRELKYYFLSRI